MLGWCADIGIGHVTIFVAFSDNLRKRASGEVRYLMEMIEQVIAARVTRGSGRWRLHVAGRLDDLPESTRHALKLAQDLTRERDTSYHLTVAVGYDGRKEVIGAIRALLEHEARAGTHLDELATRLTADDIAAHLHTNGQSDPDLIIRTSGEQRMSGFLLWQAAYSVCRFPAGVAVLRRPLPTARRLTSRRLPPDVVRWASTPVP